MRQLRWSTGFPSMFLLLLLLCGCGGSNTKAVSTAAPSALSYAAGTAVYTMGMPITANDPSSSGGAVASYRVSPTLPAGLSLSTTTGVVSGTPTAVTASASYTVTATNAGGSATATLSISVNSAAGGAIHSAAMMASCLCGTPVGPLISCVMGCGQ